MAIGKLSLRKIKITDERYFSKWWRDKELLALTSGILESITDENVKKYFLALLHSKDDYHFLILLDRNVIGHISLTKRDNQWYETQIIIGDKEYWGKGYGTKAIQLLLEKAKKLKIKNIYLEVRPDNARAISAYENSGFVKAGVREYPENEHLPQTIRMELRKEPAIL